MCVIASERLHGLIGEAMGLQYLPDVSTLTICAQTCIGCGRCLEVCPHAVFVLTNGKAVIRDRDDCMECGACAMNCPVEAITVKSGVGCASAIITGWITGKKPSCDCSDTGDCC